MSSKHPNAEILVSVIIPAYNAEKYISRCLETIIAVPRNNIEIIVIDDGSCDKTYDIVKSYAERDKRLRLLRKVNGGVSSARNEGLEQARGEWINFIDADDYIDPRLYCKILDKLDKDLDFLWGGYVQTDENDNVTYSYDERIEERLDKNEAITRLFIPSRYKYQWYPFDKFFRREILIRNNIRFDISLKYSEDRLFNYQYIISLKTKNGGKFINIPFYHYIQHNDSAMGALSGSKYKLFISEIDAFARMLRITKENTELQFIYPVVRRCLMGAYRNNRMLMAAHHDYEVKHLIRCASRVLKEQIDITTIAKMLKYELVALSVYFKSRPKS